MVIFYTLFLFLTILFNVSNGEYKFQTKYINVPIDHFSFVKNDVYKMRYLVNDSYWQSGGPIFFYTGNEGPIDVFAQNTGFLWEIAPKFNAYIVFAEHRYYGESLPFGNTSFSSPEKLGYLNSPQALADYAYLIKNIQEDLSQKNEGWRSKVIAFGGSYGGMLSAWMRLKYPGSVYGALASSAPIFEFNGLTKCDKFNQVLASVFQTADYEPFCVTNIKKTWSTIRELTNNDDGKSWLSSTLKLCNPLKSSGDVKKLIDWLKDVYANLAMVNYPYPTSFLAPLPAYPVKAFCEKLSREYNGKPLIQELTKALSVYTNYTGTTKCVNINSTSSNVDETAWDYQACTEMIMPMCVQENKMFESSPWNFTQYAEDCFKQFGVKPSRDDLAIIEYGGRDATYTNVIFTNGLLDPWSSGGFWPSTSTAYAILIPNAAHHLELRATNPNDPNEVVYARKQIQDIISAWITPYSKFK
nr:lysosomal Pro-X carboxypeptidase [Onthophagus taurus]